MEKFLWYNVQDYHGVLGAPAAATEESFMQRARELIRDIFRQTDLVLLALCCIATAFGILMIVVILNFVLNRLTKGEFSI